MRQNMKKIANIVVLALFVFSIVPAVFADLDVGVDADAGVDVLDTVEADASVEADITVDPMEKRERLREAAKMKLTKAKERVELARENYLAAKAKQKEKHEKYREHRAAFLELKGDVKTCVEGDCVELKAQFKSSAQAHARNIVAVMDASLDKLAERVQLAKDIDAEMQADLLVEIEELQEELDVHREALTQELEGQELRDVIHELKDVRKDINDLKKRVVSLLTAEKVASIELRLESVSTSMEKRIELKAEAGADVSELESIKADFDAALTHFQEGQVAIDAKVDEMKNAETREEYREINVEVRELRKDAHDTLQEARAQVRLFVEVYGELE